MINHGFGLDKSFQEILYRIDNWINEGSGWIVETFKSQYIKISTYRPLSGSSYVRFPVELRNPKIELINIKNNDQKCCLWCHVRHINPIRIHPEKIKQTDKRVANEEDFSKIETISNICINVFCYENKLTFPIYISDQKFENSVDLLLIIDENKSHYVYIKYFDRIMFHKTE